MSDAETTGWVSTANHSGGAGVYHTSEKCPRAPREEYRRPLGPNEIKSRDLRECEACVTGCECYDSGGQHCVDCPWCGEPVRLRDHLPCPDASEEGDK